MSEAEEIQRKEREAGNAPGPRPSSSVQEQLEKTELATRGLKLRQYQKQAQMIEEANAMTVKRNKERV